MMGRNGIATLCVFLITDHLSEVCSLQLEPHPKNLAFASPSYLMESRRKSSQESTINPVRHCCREIGSHTLPLTNRKSGRILAVSTNANDESSPQIPSRGTSNDVKLSKRQRILIFLGLKRLKSRQKRKVVVDELEDEKKTNDELPFESGQFEVTTLEELDDYFNDVRGRFRKRRGTTIRSPSENSTYDGDNIDYKALLASLSVKGDTQIIGSPKHKDVVHPVVQLLHERRRRIDAAKSVSSEGSSSFRNARNVTRIMPPEDGFRVALAVEGGGMRGCVTAGMVTAIHYLGLEDTIDVVYGSSAGTVIGAYFIARQLPWVGPEVYYDCLTTAGIDFINTKRFLRAVGLGLVDPRLIKDVIFRRNNGKPVLDLSFLLKSTMQENKPLDWEAFEEMQKVQPLKIVASGLRSEKAIIMDMERSSFRTIEEMANCMHASCLLPGVAGPLMNLGAAVNDDYISSEYKITPGNNVKDEGSEPLADALFFDPIPYQGALSEGATHVVCLRSRPDGVDTTGKSSVFERLIVRRFFLRKNKLRNMYVYMKRQLHKKRYAEEVITLNDASRDLKRSYTDISKPHMLPIAIPPGSPEVKRLETGRQAIFDGVRRGFARAFDALVEDTEQRGNGEAIARQVFPDEIMCYEPLEYVSEKTSSFELYMQKMKGMGSFFPDNLGKTAKEVGASR